MRRRRDPPLSKRTIPPDTESSPTEVSPITVSKASGFAEGINAHTGGRDVQNFIRSFCPHTWKSDVQYHFTFLRKRFVRLVNIQWTMSVILPASSSDAAVLLLWANGNMEQNTATYRSRDEVTMFMLVSWYVQYHKVLFDSCMFYDQAWDV